MTESRYARTSTIVPFTKRHTQQYRLSNRIPFFAVARECNSTTAQSLAISHRLIFINDCNQFGRFVHREIMQQSRTLPLIARERMSTDGTQCVMRINREKGLASLNFEQIECPKCGAKFQPAEWERN